MESFAIEPTHIPENVVQESSRTNTANLVLNVPEPPSIWEKLSLSMKEAILPRGNKSFSLLRWTISALRGLFPVLQWGRQYDFKSFRGDLMAGVTLASLGIPQSIGYANLAKLDPQYGLYTSVVPPLVYAVMGSSRELAIGPVAVVSLLLSSMVQKVVDPTVDPIAYTKLVFTVTLFAGIFQASFGLFRLGFLVDFLSHAAIVGFMAGAAIVIGAQQLKGLLGITHFTNNTDVVSVAKSVWLAVHHPWHPNNFLIGCSFLIFILIARFMARRNKKLFRLTAIAPLLSVILSTLLVFVTRGDKHGVNIIQHVNGGLNPNSAKQIQLTGPYLGECAKIGLICAVIALTEAIAVGRSFASIKGYQLDGNKEMMAMGFMNIAGSISSCYVATGSFSRTAVNFSAGCKTTVSNIVMSITVIIALQLLTRFLYYTPVAILASIILSALPGLIDIKEVCNIWQVDKMDFLACSGAFLGVLFGSVEIGLLAAVVISFAKVLILSLLPHIEILGRIQGTDIFCSMRQYPMASGTPCLLLIRIDSFFLCFMNANFIRGRIISLIKEKYEATKATEKIQSVVIDMSNVMNIDTSGITALGEIHGELVSLRIQLAIANPAWEVINKMKLASIVHKIGATWIFLTVGEAVEACLGDRKDNCFAC
ncbi:low affinity sulfate transporter 3-like [Typha angustifolia]|uniref:low affinity sulfate transporter 3-like n=1 Tax=Typha angustifolia TaxID=59011 RepID=UPI003C2C00C6